MTIAWIIFRRSEIEQGVGPIVAPYAYDRSSALEWASEEDAEDVVTIPVEWTPSLTVTMTDTAAKIAWTVIANGQVTTHHANGYATFSGAGVGSDLYRHQTKGGAWSPLSDKGRDPLAVLSERYRQPGRMAERLPEDPFMGAARRHLGMTEVIAE